MNCEECKEPEYMYLVCIHCDQRIRIVESAIYIRDRMRCAKCGETGCFEVEEDE